MATIFNYNLNVKENLVSDFKNAFPGIFDFTVGILTLILSLESLKSTPMIEFRIRNYDLAKNCILESKI